VVPLVAMLPAAAPADQPTRARRCGSWMQSTWRPCGASLPAASCRPTCTRPGLSCM